MAKQKRCEVCGCPVMSASECGGLCSPGCEAVYYQVTPADFDGFDEWLDSTHAFAAMTGPFDSDM